MKIYQGSLTILQRQIIEDSVKYLDDGALARKANTTRYKVKTYRINHLCIDRKPIGRHIAKQRNIAKKLLTQEIEALDLFKHKFPSFIDSAEHRILFLKDKLQSLK